MYLKKSHTLSHIRCHMTADMTASPVAKELGELWSLSHHTLKANRGRLLLLLSLVISLTVMWGMASSVSVCLALSVYTTSNCDHCSTIITHAQEDLDLTANTNTRSKISAA